MRVTCDKCGAAYSVDEKLIPPRGARAQCPKCKALQVLRRPTEAASAPEPAASKAPTRKATPAQSATPASSATPAAARPAALPSSAAAGVPGAGDPFDSLDLGLLDLGPKSARNEAAAAPLAAAAGARASPSRPAGPVVPPAPAQPPPGAPDPAALFGPTPASPPARPVPEPQPQGPRVPCRGCQKPLDDPFDMALGVCEDCRARHLHEVKQHKPVPETAPAHGGSDKLELSVPADLSGGPAPSSEPSGLELDDQRGAARAGSREAPRQSADSGEPAGGRRSVGAPLKPSNLPASSAMRQHSRFSAAKVAAAVLVLAIAGAGAWVGLTRPAFLFKQAPPPVAALPSIEHHLLGWKMAVGVLPGTAAEHFARGRKLFLDDRPTAYIDAEEEFKAAIVVDPGHLEAVAGYVEAFAVGRGERASPDGLSDAREMINEVLAKAPESSAARRAKANLLLTLGETDAAREEAASAFKLAKPDEQAEALLAWGRAYLKQSAPIAQEKFDAALRKDPTLKRAYYYRGLAAEYAGRNAQALADYEQRLGLDPSQREALVAAARVYAKLGDNASARKALARYASRHPDVGEPRVQLVQIAYSVERNVREADRTLRELRADLGKFDDADKLQFHTVSAAVARDRGELKSSAEQAAAALKIDPAYGPAHFQAMLTALADGRAGDARKHLEACEAKIGDDARAEEYRARVELVAGDLDAAVAAFRKAIEKAPTRIVPRLCAAALLVRKNDDNGAWSIMRKAIELDPASVSRARRQVSDYWEAPVEPLKLVARDFDRKGGEENWLRDVYGAVMRYHLGETDEPARSLDKVLALDPTSMPALVYRAQIELDRKKFDRALGFARRAVRADMQSGVAHFLVGRALDALKKTEEARGAYLLAIQKDPGLASAGLALGVLAARAGEVDDARERLLLVISAEPENVEARAALLGLGY